MSNMKKKFCVLKKVLSFGPNRTVEVRLNSSAQPNVWSVTSVRYIKWFQLVSQSRQQVVKAYCSNVYTVPCSKSNDMTPTGHLPFKLFGPTRLSVYISKEGTSIIFALGN